MREDNPQDFKFDVNEEENPEFLYEDELKEIRIEKLSQRVTMLTILLPILIAIILYIGYRDVTGRLSQSRDSVSIQDEKLSMEIEQLSKNFESKTTHTAKQIKDLETSLAAKLSALSAQSAVSNDKLLSELNQKITAIEQSIQSVQGNFKKTEDALQKTIASKIDKSDQAKAISKINAAIAPIQKEIYELKTLRQDLVTVTADVKKVESNVTKKLAEIAAGEKKTWQNMEQMQATVDKLSNQKISQENLELELLKVRKKYQQIIDLAVIAMDKQMDSIKYKIREIEKSVASNKRLSAKSKAIPPTTAGSQSASKNSGGIKEQDIPE
jgi:chromosome segregation ATPase